MRVTICPRIDFLSLNCLSCKFSNLMQINKFVFIPPLAISKNHPEIIDEKIFIESI